MRVTCLEVNILNLVNLLLCALNIYLHYEVDFSQ